MHVDRNHGMTVLDLGVNPPRQYRLYINGYHVDVSHEGEHVFVRTIGNDAWLDAKHTRVTKAIDELEAAIIAAVK